jgi:AcrR family transcriptional regulator
MSSADTEKYAPQVATHRRTTSAILTTTKELIARSGVSKISMIEISDESEVSRATLYNHYRDKESVLRALAESEFARLITVAQKGNSPQEILQLLSQEISTDTALATMRTTDPALLTQILTHQSDPLWASFLNSFSQLIPNQVLAATSLRWLIGQVFAPLTSEQSKIQSEALS